LAGNNLGEFVLPTGWTEGYNFEDYVVYRHTDGREQKDKPGKPEGILAVANAIPDMGALHSLDLSDNGLGAEGAKVLAKMLKKGSLFCKDGKCFTSKSMLAQSTCKHCGNKKSSHRNGALTQLDVNSNNLTGQTWDGNRGVYDYDFSGIQTLADALPKCQ
jgi:hypothetical protein